MKTQGMFSDLNFLISYSANTIHELVEQFRGYEVGNAVHLCALCDDVV